jgi:hypothetical protein
MLSRRITEFWRRKTLTQKLAEMSEKELRELSEEVREKVENWQLVFYQIHLERERRRKRKKGA